MSVISHAPNNTLVIGEVSHYHFYQPMNQTPSRPSQKYQPTKAIIPSVPRQHSKAPVNSPLSFIRQQKLPPNIHQTPTSPSSQSLHSTITLSTSSWIATTTAADTTCQSPPSAFLNSTSLSQSPQKHRPPFFTHSSADLLKNLPGFPKRQQLINRQRRKVSFDENVMVICTRFHDDSHNDDYNDNSDTDTKMDIPDQPEGTFLATTTCSSSPPPPYSSTEAPLYHGRRRSTGEQITNEQRQRKHWNTLVTTLKHLKYTKSPSHIASPSPSTF